ncbi:hypothetical protein GCM10011352_05010 [Marinobacterium zhoushanense]|uniref:4Fe-4S single cluster protein n=1 Tax=Marinobacterium zhoushanense TaxID=1679163 RepID=A0ABQ1K1E2_9GAMM|nr:hypothetical protein [Marinobacterium zhoushanense]GGB82196.1 hypothetical protein GCM10011352_05010 [Marinobacterium zhoushanense]
MSNILQPNSLGNNNPQRVKKAARPFITDTSFHIKELEISLNTKCNLRCVNCGFNIPNQPHPTSATGGNDEHVESLVHLKGLGLRIGKVVLVGGEIAFHPTLNTDIKQIKAVSIADQIEVVTNGLYPQGFDRETLELIDSLVISDYVRTENFESIWKRYVASLSDNVDLSFRRKDSWDDWFTPVQMTTSEAKQAWDTCFYRNYDVTLERGRLFSCSRIAKNLKDEEGLEIKSIQCLNDIEGYLNSAIPRPSCSSCSPVAGLPLVEVARQPDGKLIVLSENAKRHMQQTIQGAGYE